MLGDRRPRDGLSVMVSSVTDLGDNGILERSGSEDEGEEIGVGGRISGPREAALPRSRVVAQLRVTARSWLEVLSLLASGVLG